MGINKLNDIRKLVSTLTVEQRIRVFKEFEEFEKNSVIGDSLLRNLADRFVVSVGMPGHHVVLWMNQIAYEVWRSFCMDHIGENDDKDN